MPFSRSFIAAWRGLFYIWRRARAFFTRSKTFFLEDLWREDLRDCSNRRLLGFGVLRVVIHVGYGFSRNLGGIQAAGLTMLSLMAIVPISRQERLRETCSKPRPENSPPPRGKLFPRWGMCALGRRF